jgi:hypothetical protein
MTPTTNKKDYKNFSNANNLSTIIVPKSSPLIENDRTRTP